MRSNALRGAFAWSGYLVAMTACSDAPLENPPPPPALPMIVNVSVVDSMASIFRSLDVSLDIAGGVQVQYWAENAPRLQTVHSDVSTDHEVYLPRLRAETSYEFEVQAFNSDSVLGSATHGQFTTDTLPTDLAAYRFQVIGEATFPLVMFTGRTVMIDTDGYVVWYRPGQPRSSAFTRRDDGNFVFSSDEGIEVITPMNEAVATLSQADLVARAGRSPVTLHHDVIATPWNTLMFLVSGGTVAVGDTIWTGDEVWEWDPATDDLNVRWAASDFLSPETDRGARSVPSDWLHANSLAVGPRGNILVSFFWLHEVLSIAEGYESIEWRLGGPASSFGVADGAMEAGQHTAAEVAERRIVLFDNGRDRGGGELFSRALEIELDPAADSARIVWEFRPRPDVYTPILSSARRLDNGNTVVGFGLAEGQLNPPSTGPLAGYEVTGEGRILWQLVVTEGVSRVYRFDPLTSVAGEVEVPAPRN